MKDGVRKRKLTSKTRRSEGKRKLREIDNNIRQVTELDVLAANFFDDVKANWLNYDIFKMGEVKFTC